MLKSQVLRADVAAGTSESAAEQGNHGLDGMRKHAGKIRKSGRDCSRPPRHEYTALKTLKRLLLWDNDVSVSVAIIDINGSVDSSVIGRAVGEVGVTLDSALVVSAVE